MKIEVPLQKANRLINSGGVVLLSCGYEDRRGITTLAWNMPVSQKPPLISVSLAPKRFSYDVIKKSKEFAVNIPAMGLFKEMIYCGSHSGWDEDKFKTSGLTAQKAAKLKHTPLIKECSGHLECGLYFQKELGDHVILVGEVFRACAEKEFFDEKWLTDKVKLIYHLGGNCFTESGKRVA